VTNDRYRGDERRQDRGGRQSGHGGGAGGAPSRRDTWRPPEVKLDAVLGGDAAAIDELGEDLGRRLRELPPTQLRNFYGPIAKLRSQSGADERKKRARAHRWRVAYLVARADRKADPLWPVFGELLKRAETQEHIDSICDLAEAVVAYHKYFEKNREAS
jgi:CRISPR type III-A-associated protein Csm2